MSLSFHDLFFRRQEKGIGKPRCVIIPPFLVVYKNKKIIFDKPMVETYQI